jgi:hypothetical protein
MPDQPDLPALSDDDLRETLDLMATAVASMSDRIDDLTVVADKQIKVATSRRTRPSGLWPDRRMTGLEPIERCSNGNKKRIASKAACPGLVWVHWFWPWC